MSGKKAGQCSGGRGDESKVREVPQGVRQETFRARVLLTTLLGGAGSQQALRKVFSRAARKEGAVSEAFKNRLSTAAQSKMLFLQHLREIFPGETVETEYRFDVVRKWRFDLAIPAKRWGFEIEGGVFMRGAHTRGKGFLEDCEKYNTAQADGWRVYRFSTQQVMKGEARNWIEESL